MGLQQAGSQKTVAQKADRQTWTLAGRYGAETWRHDGAAFTELAIGTRTRGLSGPGGPSAVDAAALGLRAGRCAHPGPWPSAFAYCPECGAPLPDAPPPPAPQIWSAPFGRPSGFPALDDMAPVPGAPVAETRAPVALPPGANFSFVVAGTPPVLFAADQRSGWLHAWNPDAQNGAGAWAAACRLPGMAGLPRWSFAAAAFPAGFAVPTEHGPVWVPVYPDRDLTPRPIGPSLGARASAGGAAILRAHAAVPVRTADGFAVAVRAAAPDIMDGEAWSLVPVAGLPEGTVLAAPVANGDDAIWCGAGGQLSLSVAADGSLAAAFVPWRDGLRPLLGLRPVRTPDGVLHRLMHDGADDLVWQSLALPGVTPERRPSRGYWISTGTAVFREGRRMRLPWDAMARAEYPVPDGEFLLPLLALDERRYVLASCAGRGALGAFFDTDTGADDAARACRMQYSAGTRQMTPLGRVVQAAHAWDIVPFVFQERLHVYSASANECWSWALQ